MQAQRDGWRLASKSCNWFFNQTTLWSRLDPNEWVGESVRIAKLLESDPLELERRDREIEEGVNELQEALALLVSTYLEENEVDLNNPCDLIRLDLLQCLDWDNGVQVAYDILEALGEPEP